jgi:hypothetical protein
MNGLVWVLVPKEGNYVRGDEIVEVRAIEAGRGGSTAVEITQIRGDDRERGAGPNSYIVWTLPNEALAALACVRLIEALSGTTPGVVLLDDDGQVRLLSFHEVGARQNA